jgi:hypothetical protein
MAFVAVIELGLAAFVAMAVVVMVVIGSNPYAVGSNLDLFRKCGGGKDEQRGGDCSQNVSTHDFLLIEPPFSCFYANCKECNSFLWEHRLALARAHE